MFAAAREMCEVAQSIKKRTEINFHRGNITVCGIISARVIFFSSIRRRRNLIDSLEPRQRDKYMKYLINIS